MSQDLTFYIPFIPKEDESEKIWTMRYKDKDTNKAPWIIWKSIDRPPEVLLDSLRKEGMNRLEVIN